MLLFSFALVVFRLLPVLKELSDDANDFKKLINYRADAGIPKTARRVVFDLSLYFFSASFLSLCTSSLNNISTINLAPRFVRADT